MAKADTVKNYEKLFVIVKPDNFVSRKESQIATLCPTLKDLDITVRYFITSSAVQILDAFPTSELTDGGEMVYAERVAMLPDFVAHIKEPFDFMGKAVEVGKIKEVNSIEEYVKVVEGLKSDKQSKFLIIPNYSVEPSK